MKQNPRRFSSYGRRHPVSGAGRQESPRRPVSATSLLGIMLFRFYPTPWTDASCPRSHAMEACVHRHLTLLRREHIISPSTNMFPSLWSRRQGIASIFPPLFPLGTRAAATPGPRDPKVSANRGTQMDFNEKDIKELVRHVLLRTLRQEQHRGTRTLTAEDVSKRDPGSTVSVAPGTLVTPMARETALSRRIRIVEESEGTAATPTAQNKPAASDNPTVAVGADHGGFAMKEMLKAYLTELGYSVLDLGTDSQDAVDYPEFAYAVAQQVASGKVWRGIVLDGAGIGSCIVANKVPGVRAAMCYDDATARNSRLHNDSNVLTLGSGLLGTNLVKQIVKTWLSTDFEGGRHQRRIDKLLAIESRHMKKSNP